jgi:hypothetical protein
MFINFPLEALAEFFNRKAGAAAGVDDPMAALFYFSGDGRNSIGYFRRYGENAVTVGVKQISGAKLHAGHVNRSAEIKYVGIGM